ncbi:MAG: hypothetical protein J0H79_14030 [Alphaproteobacteria bacterium]|nr:hypothetical protein [Alphaproteobacteria bacterium]
MHEADITMESAALVPVLFPATGDMLFASPAAAADELVALKPICEALGLVWRAQHKRVRLHPVLSKGITVTVIPSPGGAQETTCLPLDLIPGFLFGIDVSRCKPAARPKVEAFQAHCFRVLRDHFRPHRAGAPLPLQDRPPAQEAFCQADCAEPDTLPDRTNALWLSLVREARILNGREAARDLWARSPLPALGPRQTMAARENADLTQFLDDCCVAGPGLWISAERLYRAYGAWARDTHCPQILSKATFGRAMSETRFARRKSNGNIVYSGLHLQAENA